jgi:predicted nucleotidyltransferase
MDTLVLARVRQVIQEEVDREGCRVQQILLFGSRARGEARPDSDWDFYVVIDIDPGFHTRQKIASHICWRLAREGIFADVFIQSEQTVLERAKDMGYLTYYALKEGVAI